LLHNFPFARIDRKRRLKDICADIMKDYMKSNSKVFTTTPDKRENVHKVFFRFNFCFLP
jgi:hypothetical protein